MGFSRRWFIGGVAACSAEQALKAFALPHGTAAVGGLRLRVGILSDIHVRSDAKWGQDHPQMAPSDTGCFIKALRYFRSRGVDAVALPGDMADDGITDQLLCVGRAWDEVFPEGKVERIFALGNHDWESWGGGKFRASLFPDGNELARHVLRDHLRETWNAAFHEDFRRTYVKMVKGYRFGVAHWPFHCDCQDFVRQLAAKSDPALPFFYLQHPHLKNTVYGPWAWGQDNGLPGSVLSAYPNAVAISGHSHYALTDERAIWQGGFTAVNAGSLKWTQSPDGLENTGGMGSDLKQMPPVDHDWSAQALVLSAYDDRLVFERVDFGMPGICESLGPDWVVPLPSAESRPFAFASRAAKAAAPVFPEGATVEVSAPFDGKTRGGKSSRQVRVSFPQALSASSKRGRAIVYCVEALQTGGDLVDEPVLKRFVQAHGFNKSDEHVWPKGRPSVECVIAVSALPAGADIRFRAFAIESFGKRSLPILSACAVKSNVL